MADDIIDGLLGGGEAEAPEVEELEAAVSADAFAAAITMNQAGYGPEVAKAAEAFLERQGRLLDVQTRHMEDEHHLRMTHLLDQVRDAAQRRFGLRIRNGLQVFTALIATAVALGVLWMVVSAFTSRVVVVDAFESSPTLAARGLNGKVVAGAVLDTLAKLQAATRSTASGLKTVSAWSSEIKVEVPETGVSLGEVERLLHERFGHDLHIGGDLTQTAQGQLALTVRGNGIPAKTFAGGADDLDKLAVQAAEYVYGRSQPVQYAIYLTHNGRDKDALVFVPDALRRVETDDDRASLANSWGTAYADLYEPAKAAEKYRLALSFKPGDWRPWNNLLNFLPFTEGEEAAWRESQRFLKAADAAPEANKPAQRFYVNAAQDTWDLPLFLSALRAEAALYGGAGSAPTAVAPPLADAYYLTHDDAQAARAMALSDPEDSLTKAEAPLLQGYAALDRGEAAAAVEPLQAYWKLWETDPLVRSNYLDNQCYLGLALGLAGRKKEAEAAFQVAGQWSRCWAFRGDVLDHAGDLAGAQQVWAEGLRIAPDMPHIYLHRGLSEFSHGDLGRAGADFATANAKAPHWADPLKSWGDLLARQGRWKDALAKYDEAQKYAPAWPALKQARAIAVRQAG